LIKPAAQAKRSLRRCTTLGALVLLTGLSVGCLCPCCFISCEAMPFADAWVDADCDGERDYDEAPLQGVCVWAPRRPDGPPWSPEYCTWDNRRTDDEGLWGAGLVSGCFTPYYIVAQTPPGFRPTTDTVVAQEWYAEFGFAPEGTCPERSVVTPEKLARQQANRGLALRLGGVAAVALSVLAYRKYRSTTRSRESPPGAE
jgi:hypothetical protein